MLVDNQRVVRRRRLSQIPLRLLQQGPILVT